MKACTAILIHFIGFYVVDSMMPEWVEMAGAWLLSKWYCAFFFVDLLAMTVAGRNSIALSYLLAMSATWSALLSAEQLLLGDDFQRLDEAVQIGFDVALCGYVVAVVFMALSLRTFRKRAGG